MPKANNNLNLEIMTNLTEELRKIYQEEVNNSINKFERAKHFSIVNFFFFIFVALIFYINPNIFNSALIVVPLTISFGFSIAIIIFNLYIKDSLKRKRLIDSISELIE